MAQIHEYTADTQVSGPDQTRQARTADTGDVGSSIERLGNSLSQAEKAISDRNAQAEVSDLSAKMSARQADLTQSLEDTVNAPGAGSDKDLSSKFMAQYDEQMSDLVDNTKSTRAQQYMEKANAALRAHFQTQSLHAQTVMAGEQAVGNFNQQLDTHAANLISDPSQAAASRELNSLAIDNLPLPDNKKDQLRSESESKLAIAEVQGWTKIDPKGTGQRLAKGEWDEDLSASQKVQLEHETDVAVKAQQIQADADQRRRDQVAGEQQDTEKTRLLQKLYSPDGLDTKEILGNPKLDFGSQKEMLAMVEKNTGADKIRTDPNVLQDTWDRVHPPGGGAPQITEEEILRRFGHGLDGPGVDRMRNELLGKKTQSGIDEAELKNNFVKSVRADLDKSNDLMGMVDPDGKRHFQSWLADFQDSYNQGRQNGKTPKQMLDPKSPDYLGSNVTQYKRSTTEIMNSIASPPTPALSGPPPGAAGSSGGAAPVKPAVEPRRPGEKAADYLKRVTK